jgi:hypothetical protein
LNATVLGATFVKSGIAKAADAAQLLNGHACFGLSHEPNVPFVGKSVFLNARVYGNGLH